MSKGRVDVREDFQISFDVYLGTKDGGADGISFILHNSPLGNGATGAPGVGLGVYGIQNGIAIEYDTFNNGVTAGDIATDHTNFVDTDKAGTNKTITSANSLGNIEDGQWHDVEVSWDATAKNLTYRFDGQQVGALSQRHRRSILGGRGLRLLRVYRQHRRLEQSAEGQGCGVVDRPGSGAAAE